jgi:glyoxylase-like metal-dependent hydrolase (beta-lactamase superfamily II)
MSIIRFPDEEVIYVVDFISLHNIPGWPVGAGLLDAWLNAIRLVEALDYEIVAPSHGVIGRRADVADVRHYVEALRNEVAAGIAAGLSVENMQATITMEQYRDWPRYGDFHRRNVEGMYRMLTD